MKNLLSILLLASLWYIPNGYALENDGLEEAEKVCRSLFTSAQRDVCLKEVNEARFFDVKAVKVCSEQFGSDKISACIKVIANKNYSQTAVEECRGRFGSANVISCFDANGRKVKRSVDRRDIDVDYLLRQTKKAIRHIEDRTYDKAAKVLENIVDELDEVDR